MPRKLEPEERMCKECGTPFEVARHSKKLFCSRICSGVFGARNKKIDRTRQCLNCGVTFTPNDSRVKCCGHSCARKLSIKNNPDLMTNLYNARDESAKRPEVIQERSERFKRMWASDAYRNENRRRMRENNPTSQDGVVEKIQKSLRESGYDYAHLNGGNGTESPYERLLLNALPEEWEMQYVYVTTDQDRSEGSPNHYKIDLALPNEKLAVEVDGRSHELKDRQAQDVKKTRMLERSGWIVLRFKNQEVKDDLERVVREISQEQHRPRRQ